MQSTVTLNRGDYLGGSDIPALLGISKYKTRWQLLREKAKMTPVAPVFANPAITYGNNMEPKIREYLNLGRDPSEMFREWKFERSLHGSDLMARGHLDGYDAENKTVLEIKTTNEYRGDNIRNYPDYLYQMLFYMIMPRPMLKSGILAVYMRPDDYNESFDETRLHIFKFTRQQMAKETAQLKAAIAKFLDDLAKIKANPELFEAELINDELATTTNKALAFERTIEELKAKEQQYKELKEKLAEQMEIFGVRSFNAGEFQVTLIDGTPETVETVKTCDFDTLELFYPEAAATCITETEKKKAGRRAAVRITRKRGGV